MRALADVRAHTTPCHLIVTGVGGGFCVKRMSYEHNELEILFIWGVY